MVSRKKNIHIQKKKVTSQTAWLPIDESLTRDLFTLTHVKGIAKVFLLIEMILAVLIVFCTLFLTILTCFK